MSNRLQKGDASLLAEMHAITSGLKVLVTTTGIQDLEVARRSMGGHGYSAFSGLGRLYADYLPSATFAFPPLISQIFINTYLAMKEITSFLISKLFELRSNRIAICSNWEMFLPSPPPPCTSVFSLAVHLGLLFRQTLLGRILLPLSIFWSGVQHYSSASSPRTLTNLTYLLVSAWLRPL